MVRHATDVKKLAIQHTKNARIQTLIMPNIYRFSATNVVTRTRLKGTLYA